MSDAKKVSAEEVDAAVVELFADLPDAGFVANAANLVSSGAKSATTGMRVAGDVATGSFDENTPELISRELSRDRVKPPELREAEEHLSQFSKEWDEAEGIGASSVILGKMLWSIGKEAVTNPKGMAYFTAEQAANMAPGMVGMVGGGMTGAAGGPAAPVTVPAGALTGAFAGQWPIEAGLEFTGYIGEELHRRGLSPTEDNVRLLLEDQALMDQLVPMARRKATGTSGVDAALTLAGGKIAAGPFREAQKLALKKLGANATKEALEVETKNILAQTSKLKRAGKAVAGVGVDVAGEGVSEGSGQLAAKGDVDMGDVALEMYGGAGGAVIEVPAAVKALRQRPGTKPGQTQEPDGQQSEPAVPISEPTTVTPEQKTKPMGPLSKAVGMAPESVSAPVDPVENVDLVDPKPVVSAPVVSGGVQEAERPMVVDPEAGEILNEAEDLPNDVMEELYGDLPEMRQETGEPAEMPPVRLKNEAVESSVIDEQKATQVEVLAHEAATSPLNATPEPTEAQKEAGNYKKGHVQLHGLDISIENPAGSLRKGVDDQGREWESPIVHHYGYIKGTVGYDKDHVDLFLGPQAETAETAYVVDQKNRDGSFDEHKVVIGAQSEEDALDIYNANYEKGWDGAGAVTAMPLDQFKAWAKSDKPKSGPLSYVESIQHDNEQAGVAGDADIDLMHWTLSRESGDTYGSYVQRLRGQWPKSFSEQIVSDFLPASKLEPRSGIDTLTNEKGLKTAGKVIALLVQTREELKNDISLYERYREKGLDAVSDSDIVNYAGGKPGRALRTSLELKSAHVTYNLRKIEQLESLQRELGAASVASSTKSAKRITVPALNRRAKPLGLKIRGSLKTKKYRVTGEGVDAEFDEISKVEAFVAEREHAGSAEVVADNPVVAEGGAASKDDSAAKDEGQDREEDEGAEAPVAHEHAAVGVDDRELSEIVEDFNDYQQQQIEGDDKIHHLFDPPKKSEIVRLKKKSDAFVQENGWLSPAEAEKQVRKWEGHAIKQGVLSKKGKNRNSDKVVISLFDKSGEWSLPWEQAGYDVYRFDIQDMLMTEHLDENGETREINMGDVNEFSTQFFNDLFGSFDGKEVHAILAACPCTDFAVSGARHFAAKDQDGRTVKSVQLVHQTLATIEHFKPSIWALENPVGRIEKLGGLPPWRLSFNPHHLGEDYTKKTLIWGRFNADLPIAPAEPTQGSKMHKKYGGKSLATKNARSVTPEGFAYSFFMANNAVDHMGMALANRYDRLDRGLVEEAVTVGMSEREIDHVVQDFYYQELDDEGAENALREAIERRGGDEAVVDQKQPDMSDKTVGENTLETKPVVDQKAGDLIDKEVSTAEIIDDLGEKIGGARKDLAVKGQKKASSQKKEAGWRSRYSLQYIEKTAGRLNDPHGGKWAFFDSRKKSKYGIPRPLGSRYFDTEQEAKELLPVLAVGEKHRVYSLSGGKFTIYREVGGRKRVRVVPNEFDSPEDGMRYMATHAEQLLTTKLNFGEEVLPRPEQVYRSGVARRKGDVKGDDFMETFGFRGVEFGNWNNQEERQEVMSHAYDALLDMADVLNIPPKAVALNGELALAFGARGRGLSSAAAHYEPGYAVINLTKMAGAGHLAHEWFHALDHYVGRLDGKSKSEKINNRRGDKVYPSQDDAYRFGTHGFSRSNSQAREELRKAYSAFTDTMIRKAETYVEDTRRADEFVDKSRQRLADELKAVRDGLSQQLDPKYYKRKNKPATEEQLQRFDELAQQLIDGEASALETEFILNEKQRTRWSMTGRRTNPVLDEMSTVYREVRGRTGFSENGDNRIGKLVAYMNAYRDRIRLMNEAQEGTEKVKRVPTEFVRQGVAADQARAGSYWSTPHELAARAFAAYTEDKLAEKEAGNDFLAYHAHGAVPVPIYPEGLFRPYPEGDERVAINKAFDTLFSTFKTKGTDKGVAMYSLSGSRENVREPVAVELIQSENLWRDANEFYRENLQGKQVENPDIGTINLSKEGRNKALSVGRRDARRMSIVRSLDSLLEIAAPYRREDDNQGRPGVVYRHAVAPALIDGELYAIDFRLREDGKGSRLFYTLAGYEMKSLDAIVRGGATEVALPSQGSSRLNTTVSQLVSAVKGEPVFKFWEGADSAPLSDVEFDAALARLVGAVDREGFVPVESAEHLPAAILADIEQGGGEASDIEGVFHDGKVYIVRDRISSVNMLESIVFHEWYGHAGLYAMMGNDGVAVRKKMVELYNLMPPGKMLKISKKHGFNLSKYAKVLRDSRTANGKPMTDDARHAVLMEEMLAYLTEEYSRGTIATKVKEILGMIRAWLRENGFARLAALNESDLAWLLKQARTHAEMGAWAEPDATVYNGVEILQRLREKGIDESQLLALVGAKYSAAWHGSPHRFDRFSTDSIGTGEGAQAYGYGLYFSESKDVAEWYRKQLSDVGNREMEPDDMAEAFFDEMLKSSAHGDKISAGKNRTLYSRDEFVSAWLDEEFGPFDFPASVRDAVEGRFSGGVYQVELAPQEDEYLLWDKPLSEQSKKVQTALADLSDVLSGEDRLGQKGYLRRALDGEEKDGYGKTVVLRGSGFYYQLGAVGVLGSEQAASEHLRSLGIRGIKYLDGSSRGSARYTQADIDHANDVLANPDNWDSEEVRMAEKVLEGGSYNYVIFDESDVEITARYRLRDKVDAAAKFTKGLMPDKKGEPFQVLADYLPERMRAAVGSVLSNPHYGSRKSQWRGKAYELALERGANANEIKYEVMAKKEDYDGLEGLREFYRTANKEEKTQIDKLLIEGDIAGREFTEAELRSDKNPLGAPAPEVVRSAYFAFRQTVDHANSTMFDRLGRLRLLPYEGSEFYDELVDLLDEKPASKHLAKRFGLNLNALQAFRKIRKGEADIARLTEKYKKERFHATLVDMLMRGKPKLELLQEYQTTAPYLIKAYDEVKMQMELESIVLPTAENFKSQKYYKDLLDLISQGDAHPMFEREELYNAYLGVQEYDSELAKLKNEWGEVQGYVPRLRKDGEQHVKVFRVDEDGAFTEVWMQPAKTKAGADRLRNKVAANLEEYIPRSFNGDDQYHVVVEPNRATPEEIFLGIGSHRAIEGLLSRAFEKATDAGIIEDHLAVQRQVLRILSDEISARGFGKHKLHRASHLIEGYETENTPAILSQFVGGMAGWLSKSEFAMRANRLMGEIEGDKPHDKVWVKDYVDDALKNSTYIDQWFGTARSFAALMFLGFKASSAMLNATQNYIWGQAVLSKYGKGATRKLLAAQRDVVKDHLLRAAGKEGVLSEEESWVLEEGSRRGRSHANYVRAMSGLDDNGGVLGKGQAGLRWLTEKAMIPFQAVETYWNREPALLAAYRVFRAQGMEKEAALAEAEKFVDDVHFVVGKENIPAMLRKMGPLGRTLYTFQSYSHNYLLGMLTSLKKGEFEVVMRSLTALVLFGGLAAVPFGEDLDKWYRRLFGERPLRLLEKWIRETGHEYTDFGDQIADFVIHGAPALAGVNFSRAIAVNVPWLSPEDDSLADRVTGVWGGLAQKVRYAGSAAAKGNYYRAAEQLSPEAIANLFRAHRHYADGAMTLSGKPIFGDDGQQVKYRPKDAIIRAFGFMPLEPSKQSQKRWDAVRAKAFWQHKKSDLLARYRAADDHDARSRVFAEIVKFNQGLRSASGGVLVPPISGKTLRQALRARPNRRELIYNR